MNLENRLWIDKMKKVLFIILFLIVISGIASADTGTYIIKEQFVDLDIHSDGNVRIKYEIEMEVTLGLLLDFQIKILI